MNDQAPPSFLKSHHKLWLAIDWCDLLGAAPASRKTINRRARLAKRWYVYILWRDDLGAPVPFYVGKGTNRRIGQHTAPSDRTNRYKSALLAMLKRRGIPVRFSIVDSFDDENSALQLEIDLISQVGRAQLKDGPLANRTLGGAGTRGHLAKSRGESYSARPVVADHVAYACLEDAAEALRVTAGALSGRIANGWAGYFYQDEGQRPLKDGVVGRYRRPVHTPSGEFASMSEAAATTGETVNSIYKRIRYGWPGYFYPEEGQRPRRRPEKPCRIGGRDFQSQIEAAEILGIEKAALRVRLRSSNFPDWVDLSGSIEKQNKQAIRIQKGLDRRARISISRSGCRRPWSKSGNHPFPTTLLEFPELCR